MVERYTYTPYGVATAHDPDWSNPAAPTADGPLYAGYHFDAETGLYHVRNRQYDAQLGTFTARDPIGYAAGDANLYRYVGNDPAGAVDPSGLEDTGVVDPDERPEAIVSRDPFMYINPRTNEITTRIPLYYVCGSNEVFLGNYDIDGGYVERGKDPSTGLPYRAAPTDVENAIGIWLWWRTPDSTEEWDQWFVENHLNNADDSTLAQAKIRLGLESPDYHDRARATAGNIQLAAEVDLLFWQTAALLARPQSFLTLRSAITRIDRAQTVQATTQRAIQSGQKFSPGQSGQIGARGEQLASRILNNQARFEDFAILKNSSNNGFDIVARTHQGKWIFYEVKTSTTVRAPALQGLQKQGATTFARVRLQQMANRTGRFVNMSKEQAANAREIFTAIHKANSVEGYVFEVTELGQRTQSITLRPWTP